MSSNYVFLGLLFGLISTSLVHLGKAMEKKGIELYSKNKNKSKSTSKRGKKPPIYIIGFVFNNSVILWQLIAFQFSSAAVFSSVFGIGLIVLLLYSRYSLREEISKLKLMGAVLIVIGTVIIGIVQLTELVNSETVNFSKLYVILIVLAVLVVLALSASLKTKIGIAVVFGLCAGILGSLDNLFKRIGLKEGIVNVGNFQTLPLFVLSFVIGTSAFVLCQLAFAKKAEASKLVPTYNSAYVAFPILLEFIIFQNSYVSVWKIVALLFITAGMFLMLMFKGTDKIKREHICKGLDLLYEYIALWVKNFKTIVVLEREIKKKIIVEIPEIEREITILLPQMIDELIRQNLLEKISYKSKEAIKKIKQNWTSQKNTQFIYSISK